MNSLNRVITELNLSKVKLSKYIGVSRQMIYNYLNNKNLNDWPIDKQILMSTLLGVNEFTEEELSKVKVTPEYIISVEKRMTDSIKANVSFDSFFNVEQLGKANRALLMDMTTLIKELLKDDKKGYNETSIRYLFNFLQSIENVPEIRYILAYMAKTNCFIPANEFAFDEERQVIFEGILFSALNLYNSNGASKDKIKESRKRFVKDIERKTEEKLGRTQKLKAINEQALKELGYNEMSIINNKEFIEKIAEIEARKGILKND